MKLTMGALLVTLDFNRVSSWQACEMATDIVGSLQGREGEFLDFLKRMILTEPSARWTAKQLSNHPIIDTK